MEFGSTTVASALKNSYEFKNDHKCESYFGSWSNGLFDAIARALGGDKDSTQSVPTAPQNAPNEEVTKSDPAPQSQPGTGMEQTGLRNEEATQCVYAASYNPSNSTAVGLPNGQIASALTSADTNNNIFPDEQSIVRYLKDGVEPMEGVYHDQSMPAYYGSSNGAAPQQMNSNSYGQPTQTYPGTALAAPSGQMNGNFHSQQMPATSVTSFGAAPAQMTSAYYAQQTATRLGLDFGATSGQMNNGVVYQQAPEPMRTQGFFVPVQNPSCSNTSAGSSTELSSSGSPPQDSGTTSPGKSTSSPKLCPVCEERATGKHYGVECCDGCKSFFRRSIRGKRNFKCDRGGKCSTKKSNHNRCRLCRLEKCLKVGMDKNSVQGERDKLLPRRKNSKLSYSSEGSKPTSPSIGNLAERVRATLKDVSDYSASMGPTLLEWGARIPGFSLFPRPDQELLLQNHRVAHSLMGIAARSVGFQPLVVMGDRFVIDRDETAPTGELGSIIYRDVVMPLVEVKPDDMELCLIMFFILFDNTLPHIINLRLLIESRTSVFVELEKYIRLSRGPQAPARLNRICSLIDGLNTTAGELSRLLDMRGPPEQFRGLSGC